MPYQSFPWEQGDSLSASKLIALDLPRLEGKSLLDVGCNSGFFCGFAQWQGAASVTGIDCNKDFLETARTLFPGCRFICRDWTELDDDKYDVILFLSAIHYAPDQQAQLDRLMRKLKPGGLLVLEIGVAPGAADEFVEVARAIDRRSFPTRARLQSMLRPYAAKMIGQSPSQAGDPVRRYVYHVRNKLPLAVLLMDSPHSGKTAVSAGLFNDKIRRLSGDELYFDILRGRRDAPEAIKKIIEQCSPDKMLNCAAVTYKICREGRIDELCELIRKRIDAEDFLLDMYVSPPCREAMRNWWDRNGFFVVDVNLYQSRARPHQDEAADSRENCQRYMEYLQKDFLINEKKYLEANPDVARAIREGRIPDAQAHYWHFGRREGRSSQKD